MPLIQDLQRTLEVARCRKQFTLIIILTRHPNNNAEEVTWVDPKSSNNAVLCNRRHNFGETRDVFPAAGSVEQSNKRSASRRGECAEVYRSTFGKASQSDVHKKYGLLVFALCWPQIKINKLLDHVLGRYHDTTPWWHRVMLWLHYLPRICSIRHD